MKSIKYSKLICALILSSQFCAQAVNWGNIKQAINNNMQTPQQILQTAATGIEQTQVALDEVQKTVMATADNIDNLVSVSKTSSFDIYNNALLIGKADSAKEVIDPLFGIINAPLAIYDRALSVLTDLTNVLDKLSKNMINPIDSAAHDKVMSLVKNISEVNSKMQDMSLKLHTAFPLIQSHAHKLSDHGTNMVNYVKASSLNR
jgi:hypothetical protein